MDLRARKYNQAAIGYLVYGVIYLAGAIYLGRIGKGPDGTAWWYVIGAAMAFGFPYLIWKRFKWVTRILAVLGVVRVIGLVRIALRAGAEQVPLPWGRRGRHCAGRHPLHAHRTHDLFSACAGGMAMQPSPRVRAIESPHSSTVAWRDSSASHSASRRTADHENNLPISRDAVVARRSLKAAVGEGPVSKL